MLWLPVVQWGMLLPNCVRHIGNVSKHCSCALCIPICGTADGHLRLFGDQASYQKIAEEMESLDGVITHGLFVDVASAAAIFTSEGVDLIHSAAFVL